MVYNRMNQDTSYLLDSVRADPNTRPPFFWHHIRPEQQRLAIMEIWLNASPLTRRFFDCGGTNGEYGPNWVAGWLLYSVFRSRDVRNNRNRRKGESGAVPDGKETYNLQCLSVQIELIGGFYRKKEDRRDDVAQERLLRPRAEWNTVIVA